MTVEDTFPQLLSQNFDPSSFYLLGQIDQLSQVFWIKDEEILRKDKEIKPNNPELETWHLQIKNMDDLRSRIVELESERNELLKRVALKTNNTPRFWSQLCRIMKQQFNPKQ